MCGIAGFVATSAAQPIERATLERMTDLLAYRGPDERGFYESRSAGLIAGHPDLRVGLGHRRLSIIDRACGHQPMANEDETVWIVFNGEIYNFQQLRLRLEGAGHQFRTASDTEVLVHLYEEEQLDFARHLNGMFALAIWDARTRRLVLARDRMGKKPLVYRHEGDRLLFASQLKSILAVPGVPREVDPHALDCYLTYQYVPHPQTIFRGMHKLPPGHLAVWQDGKLSVERFWQPSFSAAEPAKSEAESRRLLRDTLRSAVELRLQADVPLGAFLSGGIDSSIVVGLMRELTREPVKTFSIGFPVPEYDETAFARQAAAMHGTSHHEFQVEPDHVDVLHKLVWYYDEPFADSSAIPTYYVSRATREHVTVALTGDGGDELFAGYLRYRAVRVGEWFDRLPAALRRLATGSCWQRLPHGHQQRSVVRRLQRLVTALDLPPERRYLDWVAIFNLPARAGLYSDEFLAQLPASDPAEFLEAAFAPSAGRDQVTRASLADLLSYLPCDLMTKVDVASMANSLECRCPFLDPRLIDLAAGMPIEWKYRGGKGKRILLETFGDLLPDAVRRRGKMGFGVPLDHWFRHELRDFTYDTLFDRRALGRGYFRPEGLERLWQDHQSRRFDHSHRLWSLLVLELWHRQWMDADAAPRGQGG